MGAKCNFMWMRAECFRQYHNVKMMCGKLTRHVLDNLVCVWLFISQRSASGTCCGDRARQVGNIQGHVIINVELRKHRLVVIKWRDK